VLAAEHLACFRGFDVDLELVNAFEELAVNRLATFGPFDEDAEVISAPPQRLAQCQLFFEPAPSLEQLLRVGLILPEVRIGNTRFYPIELGTMTRGVKDNSADRPTVSPAPDTA
jgi:hypothetical protein